MEALAKTFLVVQKELQEQSEKINELLEDTSMEIQKLDDKFLNVKTVNQKLLDSSPTIEKKKIENDIKFNQYLYDLELRKKMAKKTFYKNELQLREMYVVRCTLFMNYMVAQANKNEIQTTQSFFAFINYVYSEFVKKYQYQKDFYLEKKNIHENYVLFLSLFPTIDKERKEQIEKNILTEEDYQSLINKIEQLDKTLEEYKQVFKTKKPRITKKDIENNSCFNFDIELVVQNIYPGLKKDEVQNTK